jgi:hypothetical protein
MLTADLDDANFINLAIGAQRTGGAVYQLAASAADTKGRHFEE